MDTGTLFTILGCTIGSSLMVTVAIFSMFLWVRGEASADRRQMHDLMDTIRLEIKDFHGRLCAIEEGKKYRNMARKDRKWYG